MRKPLLPSIMLLSMLPLIAGGCVKMGGGLDQKVAANEQAIRQLNSQLSGVQPAQADTWSQVQALRQEVAGLRGDIDTLLYSLQAVGGAHQMADSLMRHDKALRQIESQMALELDLDTPVLPPASVQTPLPAGYGAATQPATGAVDPLTGQPLAQPAAPAAGAVDPLTGLPLGSAAAMTAGTVAGAAAGSSGAGNAPLSPLPASPAPAPVTPEVQPAAPVTPAPVAPAQQTQPVAADTAQALYDAGLASFNARNYEQALQSFKDFAQVYPKHKLISNAWFWQGESYWQLARYAEAALAYEKVISGFPNSNKAPDAYFKQGMCFLNLNKKDAAKQRLSELIKKYPKAPQARRAKQVIKEKKL